MSNIDKFQDLLDDENNNSDQLNKEEQNMLEFSKQLKSRQAKNQELPPQSFIDNLESKLLQEFANTNKKHKSWNWDIMWQKFSPVTYPVAALMLVIAIYAAFGGKTAQPVDTTELETELLAYEETLSDLESDIYLMSDLTYLSSDIELASF